MNEDLKEMGLDRSCQKLYHVEDSHRQIFEKEQEELSLSLQLFRVTVGVIRVTVRIKGKVRG